MELELVDLVRHAQQGAPWAWEELVRRFRGRIGAITRSFRMGPSEAADVAQTTWLRLVESIDHVREPNRLGAWIGTTARRECLRVLRSAARELPTDDMDHGERSRSFAAPGDELIAVAEREALTAAVEQLPGSHRRLITALLASRSPSYAIIADSLGLPIGSIGPTRGRAIERLRRSPQILALAG